MSAIVIINAVTVSTAGGQQTFPIPDNPPFSSAYFHLLAENVAGTTPTFDITLFAVSPIGSRSIGNIFTGEAFTEGEQWSGMIGTSPAGVATSGNMQFFYPWPIPSGAEIILDVDGVNGTADWTLYMIPSLDGKIHRP